MTGPLLPVAPYENTPYREQPGTSFSFSFSFSGATPGCTGDFAITQRTPGI